MSENFADFGRYLTLNRHQHGHQRLADRPVAGRLRPALLQSQLEALEPLEADEPGVVIRADAGPDVLVERVVENLS